METSQDDCEIASVAPDIVPLNPISENATRVSSVMHTKTPAKDTLSEPSNDTSKKPTNGEKIAQDEGPLQSNESPSTIEDVSKAPSEPTQDNNASAETIVNPEEVKIPEMSSDTKEDKV